MCQKSMKLKRKLILKNSFSICLLYKVIGLITFLLKCSVYFEHIHHIAFISVPHVSHLPPWYYVCVCNVPCVTEMKYLCVLVWLILLSKIVSSTIHLSANDVVSLFWVAEYNPIVYTYCTFFVHSSVGGHICRLQLGYGEWCGTKFRCAGLCGVGTWIPVE